MQYFNAFAEELGLVFGKSVWEKMWNEKQSGVQFGKIGRPIFLHIGVFFDKLVIFFLVIYIICWI